jgi:hypothetical protein
LKFWVISRISRAVMDIRVGASITLTGRTKHRKRSRYDADEIGGDVNAEKTRDTHTKSQSKIQINPTIPPKPLIPGQKVDPSRFVSFTSPELRVYFGPPPSRAFLREQWH